MRKQLVEQRTRICQQITSKLTYHGIEPPEELKTNWTGPHLEWLESSPTGRFALDLVLAKLVETYRQLDRLIGDFEDWLEAMAQTPRYRDDVELLRTAPQVGLLTAMTFLIELQDPVGRFRTCEKIAGYLGPVPSESSSGERTSRESITRAGNRRVRTSLVEAAWRVCPQDEQLSKVYYRIKDNRGEHGAQIAIVAVAQRLALAFRAMLRDRNAWREQQEEARQASWPIVGRFPPSRAARASVRLSRKQARGLEEASAAHARIGTTLTMAVREAGPSVRSPRPQSRATRPCESTTTCPLSEHEERRRIGGCVGSSSLASVDRWRDRVRTVVRSRGRRGDRERSSARNRLGLTPVEGA